MHVFLTQKPESEEAIEQLLAPEVMFVPLPEGGHRMLTMPKAVVEAHDFAVRRGLRSTSITKWALEQAKLTGHPFELTYPALVYFAARKVREADEGQ